MVSRLSNNIIIQAKTYYQAEYSNPVMNSFMFAYRITIINQNPFNIQVLGRSWTIWDSIGRQVHKTADPSPITARNGEKFSSMNPNVKYVNGKNEGVKGLQPVIEAGEEYEYVSGCDLHSEIGYMVGHYYMINLDLMEQFVANTPIIEFMAFFKLN